LAVVARLEHANLTVPDIDAAKRDDDD